MNKRIKKLWIEALGEYEQGFGQLRKGNKFCCLGVLCDLHAKELGRNWETAGVDGINEDSYLDHTLALPPMVFAWAGLDNDNPLIEAGDGPKGTDLSLAGYNDGEKEKGTKSRNFAEIATLIEEYL